MKTSNQCVVFALEGQRYALPLDRVERIIRAVEVTPLPEAPAVVLGVVNVEGRILPVFNLRQRFQLPQRDISPTDSFVIAYTSRREVVVVIDEAIDVIQHEQSSLVSPDSIAPGLEQFKGIIKLDDGLVLIHDLEKLLSPDEEQMLTTAIQGRQ